MRTNEEERAALDKALDEFTNDCRARLHEMVKRGKRGWDNPQWNTTVAVNMYGDALRTARYGERLHLHDIANRAMMLWWQAYRKTPATAGKGKNEIR